jgi:hypothetical protein
MSRLGYAAFIILFAFHSCEKDQFYCWLLDTETLRLVHLTVSVFILQFSIKFKHCFELGLFCQAAKQQLMLNVCHGL